MSVETEEAIDQDAMADDWAAAMAEQSGSEMTVERDVEKVEAQTLNDNMADAQGDVNLDVILDIPVTIAMEIGRTRISIRNLLQLNQGSVIELDRLAGEPMDVLVNGTLVAHGEVVVVNEKFGIRVTDIISPSERVEQLQ